MLYIVKHTAGPSAGYVAAMLNTAYGYGSDLPAFLADPAGYAAGIAAEVNANVPGAEAAVEVIDADAEWAAFLEGEGLEVPPAEGAN